MKINCTLMVTLLLSCLAISCESNKKAEQKEEIVAEQDPVPGPYGEKIDKEGMVSLASMLETLEQEEVFEGKISGEIKEVCVKKGCWLTLDLPNGEDMRVTFKDYGFFVPTTSQGYPVVLEGKAIRTVTDVKTLRHYAEDGGASPEEIEKITEPKEEFTFEATGVLIATK